MKKRLLIIGILLIVIGVVSIFIINYYRNKSSNVFIMYIEDTIVTDDYNYVSGTIKSGTVKVNDKIDLVGIDTKEVEVEKIYVDKKEVKEAKKGDYVRISAKGIDITKIKRGMILATKDYVTSTRNVKVKITLNDEEGLMIENGTVLVFRIGTEDYAGVVSMKDSLVSTQTGIVDVVIKRGGLKEIGKGKIVDLNN